MATRWAFLAASLLPFLTGGCLDAFLSPSAYQSQRYYCDDENSDDFQVLYVTCTNDQSCAGVFSMRGTLQGDPLTVGDFLKSSSLGLVQAAGSPDRFYDILRLQGHSPYFQFDFHMRSIGGQVGIDTTRLLQINAGARKLPSPLADDQADVGITLEASGISSEQLGVTDSGTMNMTKLSDTEVRGIFHSSFGSPTDVVDGCFIVIPQLIAVNPTPL